MSLEADEFIRRFLLHVLPRGFVKIRYFGLWANCHRATKLALCRELLQACDQVDESKNKKILTPEQRRAVERRCPLCRQGLLRIVEWLSAAELLRRHYDLPQPARIDSS